MPISITYDDVRSVLDADVSDVSDADLTPDKSVAEGIVNDELDPHSANTEALEQTAMYLAAAIYHNEGVIAQLSQGSQQVSYSGGALGYLRLAQMRDPTGRLKDLDSPTVDFYVPGGIHENP